MEYEDKLIVQKVNIKIVFFKFPFQGKAGFVRPPPLSQGSLHLFDSCVDNVNNPKMYIVFEFDQSYPRYLIKYNFPNQSYKMGYDGYSLKKKKNPSIPTSNYQSPLRPVSYSNVPSPYPSPQNPKPSVLYGNFLAPYHHAPVLYSYPQTLHSNPEMLYEIISTLS